MPLKKTYYLIETEKTRFTKEHIRYDDCSPFFALKED